MLQRQKPARVLLERQCDDGWERRTAAPVEAVVRVVRQDERWHHQTTRHGAHLLTQPLHILTDPLISAQPTHHDTSSSSSCPHPGLYRRSRWWLTGCPPPPWAHWPCNKPEPGNRRRGGSRSAFSSSSHTWGYRWTDPGFSAGQRGKRARENTHERKTVIKRMQRSGVVSCNKQTKGKIDGKMKLDLNTVNN